MGLIDPGNPQGQEEAAEPQDNPQEEAAETPPAAAPQGSGNSQMMQRYILAGMKLMYDPKSRQIFLSALQSKRPIAWNLAFQAAGLLKTLDDRVGNRIPKEMMFPIAASLMFEMASVVIQLKLANPTADDLKAALGQLDEMIRQAFQIGKQGDQPGAQPGAQPNGQPGAQPPQGGAQPPMGMPPAGGPGMPAPQPQTGLIGA